MKKLFTFLVISVLVLLLMLSACSNNFKYIADGNFKYHYIADKDSYAVIGTTELGKTQDVLYFPAYYNDKLVTNMGYAIKEGYMGVSHHYWIGANNITAKKVYFPYTVEDKYYTNVIFSDVSDSEIYFVNCNESYLESAVLMAGGHGIKYYVTPSAYEYIVDNIKINGMQTNGDINIANTLYLFNYENAPNDGYFFINNFHSEALIEPAPYQPQRFGYTFGGWYKEAECISEWGFTSNALSEADTNSDNNPSFEQIKLYAKWIEI